LPPERTLSFVQGSKLLAKNSVHHGPELMEQFGQSKKGAKQFEV
jgi:hypothetical protein